MTASHQRGATERAVPRNRAAGPVGRGPRSGGFEESSRPREPENRRPNSVDPGPGLAAHPGKTTLRLLLIVVLLMVAGGGPTPIATAASAQAPSSGPAIRLVSQTAWVAPSGGEFDVRFRVENVPDDAEISFRLYPRIVNGRNRFLDTIRATDKLGPPLTPAVPVVPLTNIPAESDGSYQARFNVESASQPLVGFLVRDPGVYPFVIELRRPNAETLTQLVTHLVKLPPTDPDPSPLFATSVIVPLRAPVATRTDGSVDLGNGGPELAERVAVLDRHRTVPVNISATPETLRALVDTDQVDPAMLRRIASGRQVFNAPYVHLDLGSWVNGGPALSADLGRQFEVGTRTLTDLLGAPDSGTALMDPTVTVEALTFLRGRGAKRVVAPESMLFPLPPTKDFDRTLTRTFELDGPVGTRTPAVGTDAVLASHVQTSTDAVLNAHRTIADLAILHDDSPALRRGVVLQLPDDVPAAYLDTLLSALDAAGQPPPSGRQVITPVTIDGLFSFAEAAGDKGGQTFTESGSRNELTLARAYLPDPSPGLGNYPQSLANAHSSLNSLTTMLPDDPQRTEELSTLLLVSGAAELPGTDKQGYLDAAVATVNDVADAITFPEQPEVTLTASEGRLPLTIDNAKSVPVRVKLTLTSDRVQFVDGDVQDLTLNPGSNRLQLAIRTRVSGFVQVQIGAALTSPDGERPVATTKLTLRSTSVGGVGLGISIGAGVFLALWWGRHILRERKARRSPPDSGDDDGPTSGVSGPGPDGAEDRETRSTTLERT